MTAERRLTEDAIRIDPSDETERICAFLRQTIADRLHRRGAVVAVSGGVDSSVVAALCVRALGKKGVLALLLPERESAAETDPLGRLIVDRLGVGSISHDITPILESTGCYERRLGALRGVLPDIGPDWRFKIVLPAVSRSGAIRLFSVVAETPEGEIVKKRLTHEAYLGLVAATNFKQRVRKMLEYYYADLRNFAVVGTPNRLEYDQGFFVKLGDGAADAKPIAHLYKTQVYQLAEYLEIPEEISSRPPTTNTYSLPQSQEEFFFSLPYREMDLCLFGKENGHSPEEVATVADLSVEQVEAVYADIEQKRRTTAYLHLPPLLVEGERKPED